jgi:DNA-binding beta-propeller fold protein YncE
MNAFPIKIIRMSASLIVTLASIFTISAVQVRWKLDTVVSAGTNCLGIAATSDGSRIIVTNSKSPGTISILSTTNYSLLGTVSSVGAYPGGIAVTRDSKTAYIAASVPWGIRGVSLSNDSVIGTFATPCVGTTLYGIAITPGGNTIVFPDLSSGCTVEGIRLINGISTTSTPEAPNGMIKYVAKSPFLTYFIR